MPNLWNVGKPTAMTDVLAQDQEPWVPEDSFATRLIQLRKHMKWTQHDAAVACEVDDGSWSNWENGAQPRRLADVVTRIADRTGCDRDWLMWGPLTRWNTESAEQLALPFDSHPVPVALVSAA